MHNNGKPFKKDDDHSRMVSIIREHFHRKQPMHLNKHGNRHSVRNANKH